VLSFVPGDVARYLPPAETAGEDVLVALARLIRVVVDAMLSHRRERSHAMSGSMHPGRQVGTQSGQA
jgi:hypothetical protein